MKSQITKKLATALLILISTNALAATAGEKAATANAAKAELIRKYSHEPTQAELKNVYRETRVESQSEIRAVDWKPAPEISDYKYVLLSSEAGFSEAANLRYTIAKNLPDGVKLVLLVTNSNAEQVKRTYSQYISPDRLILAKDSSIEGGFWARDSFPYPVVDPQGKLSLVAAKYYRTFRSSPAIASSLGVNMIRANFTFVGGNLMADDNANCFTIDSYRRFTTTENDLYNVYGCKKVYILKRYSGIGDVDEVVKVMSNNLVLTNTPEYINDFKAWGYNVIMMPAVPNSYRTYINSLIIGKNVFMPTYGIATDEKAKKVYEDLGYTVFGIPSNILSDDMHGSVHCQSMAYPAMDEQQLLNSLGLQRVE
jgi:hypothetical protein